MLKELFKTKARRVVFRVIKKTMPFWLPTIVGIFFVILTVNVLSDFFNIENFENVISPIDNEAVVDYKEYESKSILEDELGYEQVYTERRKTKKLINRYLSLDEINLSNPDWENSITIENEKTTRPYRSFYELLTAMEVVSGEEQIYEIDSSENFISDFRFNDNDIKHFESKFIVVETFIDGKLKSDKRYQMDSLNVRPAGQLDFVSTIFHDITFKYEKETINETDWKRSKRTKTSTIKKGDKKVKKKIVTTTYTRSKDEVYVLKETSRVKNMRLEAFISQALEDKMRISDLVYVYEYGRALEDSDEFATRMLEYLSPESTYSIGDIYLKESTMTTYVGGDIHWPSPGYKRVTSPFGYRIHPISGERKFHTGIDIAIPHGEEILAAQDGEVIYAGFMGGYGNVIIIDHGGGISTLYAHNSRLVVRLGSMVNQGDKIAECGSTGMSTGAHLHFEVRVNGEYKNPFEYISKENL